MKLIKILNFLQGTIEGENLISFDTEKPQFKIHVNSFYVTKYCITEKTILNFINDGGYRNKVLEFKWMEMDIR